MCQADGAQSAREKLKAHLRHVDLEFAAGVTDAGLLALRGCALETLNLNACQQCVRLALLLCGWSCLEAQDIHGSDVVWGLPSMPDVRFADVDPWPPLNAHTCIVDTCGPLVCDLYRGNRTCRLGKLD